MIGTGTLFLNKVFKVKAPRKRIGKRFAISMEGGEIVWGLITAFSVLLVVLSLFFIMGGNIPTFFLASAIYGPVGWIGWPLVGFFLGRNFAHMSPFMKQSGEGASAWFLVTFRKMVNALASKVGLTPTYLNPVITVLRDSETHEPQIIMAKEYIGIAPAPSAPFVKNPWMQEFLKEIPHEERDYNKYEDACEIIDVIPEGSLVNHTEKRRKAANLYFNEEKRQADIIRKSILRQSEKENIKIDHNSDFWSE